MTKESFLRNVKLLVQMYSEGLLGGQEMPEDVLIGTVPKDDLPNVLTPESLNYQRNSYTLWQSVALANLADQSRWIFHPQSVSKRTLDELRKVLLHHRVAIQPNRHPEIWQRVATGIMQSSARGDVLGLIPLWLWSRAGFPSLQQF